MTYQPNPEDVEPVQPESTPSEERSELVAELQQLGQQLESTFKAFVAGPGQTIRREVSDAFSELGTQVQRAMSAIQERPQAAEIEQKARRAIQQVGERPIVREVEETLVTGVQSINTQLRKLVDRLERPGSADTQPAATTQRLHVEDESGLGDTDPANDQPPTAL